MTISQKQLEANRMNALKSTGPRTPEGKALVALNPIRHGLLSKEVLLQDEDESALVDLGKRLRHDLAPVGELEILLVDRIIAAAWRLRRILRLETEMIDYELQEKEQHKLTYSSRKKGKDIPTVTLWEAMEYGLKNRDVITKLQRYESHIERGMYKALHELQRLQAARQGEHVPPPAVMDVDGITLQSAQ